MGAREPFRGRDRRGAGGGAGRGVPRVLMSTVALGVLASAANGFSQSAPASTVPSPPAQGSTAPSAGSSAPNPSGPSPSGSSPSGPNPTGPNQSGTGSPGAGAAAPAAKTFTVPAGTKVLLQLRSSINSRSARPGDGVYLASTFPVAVGNRVLIPSGVYVQGVVDRVTRAGRIKGRAQLDLHFTSMIFPNGSVVEIPGIIDAMPGAKRQKVKDNGEGTVEQDGDKGRNAGKVAEIGIPTGGTVGSISGIGTGHPVEGGLIGLGAGAAAAGIVSLFTRGADVNIESGTQVEMVLQRPLILEEQNLAGGAQGATALVPSPDQPKPIDKARVLCPPGGLGCQ